MHQDLPPEINRLFEYRKGYFLLSPASARTAIFIDGPNLSASVRKLGFDIDFKRLLHLFQGQSRLIRALYYTPVDESADYPTNRPLVDWLDYNGFSPITKPIKEFATDNGTRKVQPSIRVELAVDALALAPNLDQIVLFSGDGEFQYLVAALKGMGKRVSVVSTLQTEVPMIADELRREADVFVDLVDLERKVGRPPSRRTSR